MSVPTLARMPEFFSAALSDGSAYVRELPLWLVLGVAALGLAIGLLVVARVLKWALYGALFVLGAAALLGLALWLVD